MARRTRRTFKGKIPIQLLTAFLERAAKVDKLRYAIVLANYAERDENGVWTVSIGVRQLADEIDGEETDTTKSAASRALRALMDCNALYLVSKGAIITVDGKKTRVASVYAINSFMGAESHSEMHPKMGAENSENDGIMGAESHSEMHRSIKNNYQDKEAENENAILHTGKTCPDCGCEIIGTANYDAGIRTFTCECVDEYTNRKREHGSKGL